MYYINTKIRLWMIISSRQSNCVCIEDLSMSVWLCFFFVSPSVEIHCTVSKTPADLQIRLLWLKCFSLWKLRWVKSGQSDAHKSSFSCHGTLGRSKKVQRDWLQTCLSQILPSILKPVCLASVISLQALTLTIYIEHCDSINKDSF